MNSSPFDYAELLIGSIYHLGTKTRGFSLYICNVQNEGMQEGKSKHRWPQSHVQHKYKTNKILKL
jgi:hypothetical protein